jgi:hypothetical protein
MILTGGKIKYSDRNLLKYYIADHKSHMECPGIQTFFFFVCGEKSVIDTANVILQSYFSNIRSRFSHVQH